VQKKRSKMAKQTVEPVVWITSREPEGTPARTRALARVPGVYRHPTVDGLSMSVSPKLKAVYRWRMRDRDGVQQSGTFGEVAETGTTSPGALTLEAAVQAFYDKQRELKQPVVEAAPGLTFGAAFEVWLTAPKKGGGAKSETTLSKYATWYKKSLQSECGPWELRNATTAQWQAVLRKVKGRDPHQARALYWVLSGVYKHFIELEEVSMNPLAKQVLRNEFDGQEVHVQRSTQIAALDLSAFVRGVEALRGKRNESRRALMLLLLLGWRASAVLRMKWDRIDFETGVYDVRAGEVGWKGYVGPMPLHDYARAYLTDRRDAGGDRVSEYVFPSPMSTAKKPYRADVRHAVKSACRYLGYEIITHDLRRTFATVAEVVLGGNARLVGLLMAHRQAAAAGTGGEQDTGSRVTKRYFVRNLAAERESGRQVAEALLEIAGVLPISDETRAVFKARGVSVEKLELVELEDDDDDAEADESGTGDRAPSPEHDAKVQAVISAMKTGNRTPKSP